MNGGMRPPSNFPRVAEEGQDLISGREDVAPRPSEMRSRSCNGISPQADKRRMNGGMRPPSNFPRVAEEGQDLIPAGLRKALTRLGEVRFSLGLKVHSADTRSCT
jgi:hypothetical protein